MKANATGITKAVVAGGDDINATSFGKAIHLVAEATGNLEGGDKADTIVGGTDANVLETNLGNDTLTGGGDADTFTIPKVQLLKLHHY